MSSSWEGGRERERELVCASRGEIEGDVFTLSATKGKPEGHEREVSGCGFGSDCGIATKAKRRLKCRNISRMLVLLTPTNGG